MCPVPVAELAGKSRMVQNTVALGVIISLFGLEFQALGDALTLQFQRKGQTVVDDNVGAAQAAFDYAGANFEPFDASLPTGPKPLAVWTGNEARTRK